MKVEGKQVDVVPQEQGESHGDKLVLIVDDVNLMCHFLYETLKPIPNIETRTTGDFSAAESILANSQVDLAIIDIHLKNASGLTLAKKIREGRYLCRHDIPILIFSGNTYKKEIQMCLAYDISDILAKPLNAGTVRARVRKALKRNVQLKSPDYYKAIVSTSGEAYKTEFAGAFVKNLPPPTAKKRISTNPTDEVKKHSFIKWPEDLSSGYHQIDRRLKHVTYLLNMLHHRKRTTEKYPNIVEDIKNIRLAIDDILYVAKGLKQSNAADSIWRLLFQRLSDFSKIKLETFATKTSNTHYVNKQFKEVRSKWLIVLSKPVMKEVQSEKHR